MNQKPIKSMDAFKEEMTLIISHIGVNNVINEDILAKLYEHFPGGEILTSGQKQQLDSFVNHFTQHTVESFDKLFDDHFPTKKRK